MTPRLAVAGAALVASVAALTGCSFDGGGPVVAIVASETDCKVAETSLKAGSTTFEVDNKGNDATEVYVYAAGNKVVTEKENIGPGTKASFSVDLASGQYEIACKPGQKGSGIRRTITVS